MLIISLIACITLIIKKQISPEIKTVAIVLDCCKIASRNPLLTSNVIRGLFAGVDNIIASVIPPQTMPNTKAAIIPYR